MKGAVLTVLCAVALTRGAVLLNQNGCPLDYSIEKLLPHPNCGQYYQCIHGVLLERFCPGGLHFSAKSDACDFPAEARCNNQVIVPEKPIVDQNNPSQAATICSTGSNGITVSHERCNYYYKCVDGKPVATKCSSNFLYNPLNQRCDWAVHVSCGDRTLIIGGAADIDFETDAKEEEEDDTTIAGHDDPSQAPAICAAAGSNGVLIAHETCNRFYKCSYGLPVAMRCPSTLLYDPSKERCEWPHSVDCGNRVIPDDDDDDNIGGDWTGDGAGNSDPSQAPAICAAEESDHIYIAHENCNQFYKCWAGVPVAMDCPFDHLFDPSKDYCDFPYSVDCGERIIPENHGNDNQGGNNNDNTEEEEVPSGNNHDDPSQALAICGTSGSDGVLVAHENCNQFYKCTFGLPVALICPGNLLFDPNWDRCEWRETVDCGNRVIPEVNDNVGGGEWTGNGAGNDDPSQAPAICAAEDSDHIYIAHENCNQFYKCWAGLPVAMDCPPNHLFNPNKDYCDFPYNVDCGERVIPENFGNDNGNQGGNNNDNTEDEVPIGNNHDDPNQASTICGSQESEGILVAHRNCNQFYKCSFGLPVAMVCPGNLLFDPTKDRCEWRDTVDCGKRVIPEVNDNDAESEWTGNGAGNDDPSQAPAICAAEDSDHIYIAHENCNQFYKCWAGLPVAMDCPPNHLFNPNKDYCDFPYNVDCGERVITENFGNDNGNQGGNNNDNTEDEVPIGNNHDDPNQASTICGSQESEGILVAHRNCNQFYKCSFGLPVAMVCPGNLLFDPTKDRCEWRDTVDCGKRVIPEVNDNDAESEWTGNGAGNDDPSQAPAICAAEDSDHILIAHENCNQYYQCWAGFPVALNCPPNHFFNPKKDYCDFPHNVDCNNRLVL